MAQVLKQPFLFSISENGEVRILKSIFFCLKENKRWFYWIYSRLGPVPKELKKTSLRNKPSKHRKKIVLKKKK